jgi:hypothetical protein
MEPSIAEPRRDDRITVHEIGAAALQHEIRHAAGDLCGMARVATEE